MVRAWYLDKPDQFISRDELYDNTGVEYFKLDVNTYSVDGFLDSIKKERGYSYEDEMVCSKESMTDYEERLKVFATEHLHSDEEIRFFLDGSGYFDVRDGCDRWIRIEVSGGDMIILPGGIYHRFTMGPHGYIKLKRFFSEVPAWHAHNRPAADEMACRQEYVQKLRQGFVAAK